MRVMRIAPAIAIVFFCLGIFAGPSSAVDIADLECDAEERLAGRTDVAMCEPWESDTWYSDQQFAVGGGLPPFRPVDPEEQLNYASLTSTGCVHGRCLKLHTVQYKTRALNIHWPLQVAGLAPEELYFRYYLKLGPNWTSLQCDSATGEEFFPGGGKFPGMADARDSDDAYGQCGNGGAKSDGINCWSARGGFQECSAKDPAKGFPYSNTCEFSPNAATRIGSYIYVPDTDTSSGAVGLWDFVADRQTLGPDYSSACRRDDPNNPDPQCYCKATTNMFCGIGSDGMLQRDRWYAIETYIKMNTPGVADGVLRGWVDGVLSYEKTNMLYRKVGHDNLHVRTIWLNVHKGGTKGNCNDGYVYLDQMVVAENPIGLFSGDQVSPMPPSDLFAE